MSQHGSPNMKLFASAEAVRSDTAPRANHGCYWSKEHIELAKKQILQGYTSWNIAVNLKRQLSGLCIKMEKEGLLKAVYNHEECGSDYYLNVPTNNPCTESLTMCNEVLKNQNVVFGEVIENLTPDRLMVILTKIQTKAEQLSDLRAPDNKYIAKQFEQLSQAKAAVLAELEKHA